MLLNRSVRFRDLGLVFGFEGLGRLGLKQEHELWQVNKDRKVAMQLYGSFPK